MIELADLTAQTRERIEEIGTADLVLATARAGAAELSRIAADTREAIGKLYSPTRTLLIHSGEAIPEIVQSDSVRTLAMPALREADPLKAIADAYRAVFSVARNLNARAIVMLVSDADSITPQWIYGLARPILELDFDLVTPYYAHAPSEGLLNSGVIAPFMRALYGRRIQHPLGPDFGFSAKFVDRLLNEPGERARTRSLASITVDAICEGFEICQANVGVRRYPAADWANQSSVLAQILGPLFVETEYHAARWQRIRGSQPVSTFGEAASGPGDGEAIDVRRLIDSFQLGHRNLQEIWSAVLPPGTLLELSKMAKQPREHFHMPDLAWVASFCLDAAVADETSAARRGEDLALAFEAAKPYLVSRWRWPDRFSP